MRDVSCRPPERVDVPGEPSDSARPWQHSSPAPELSARLGEDLRRDLIGAVPSREPDEWLAVAIAELLHVAEDVAGPADGQEDQGDLRAGHGGLERRDRLML